MSEILKVRVIAALCHTAAVMNNPERQQPTLDSGYAQKITEWRTQREVTLRAPDGWLTLTNLHILSDGAYSIGSDSQCAIALPAHAPAHLGTLHFSSGAATLQVETDVPVQANGVQMREIAMTDSTAGAPTLVTTGTTTFFIHHIGDIRAVRVRDSAHPARASFGGCIWYPVDPGYCVRGRLQRFEQPQAVSIATVTDHTETYQAVGELEVELQGTQLRLLALSVGKPNLLFVIFRDASSGKTTYGPARFLTMTIDEDGATDVDFNMAFNPPCAVTPYATCPLPPPQNVLRIAIEAGERYPAK
jgi:uncharacterized protein